MSQLESSPPNDRTATHDAGARSIVLGLFAASGCAALVYQVVWLEQLTLAIGSSAISVGVLLATFLGGLCIGSLAFARFAVAARQALRRYALLEFLIGVLGILTLYAIPVVGSLYTASGASGGFGLALRLIVAAVCLLPATILMGATLPTIAQWVRTAPNDIAWLGYCYAANTIGAVVGSVLAGFYLLRVHDVVVATAVAALLNLGAAAVAVSLAPRARGEVRSTATIAPARAPASTATPWAIYLATALSGMTALSAEVLWTRHLTLLLGGTVYTFALILAVFLFGLGSGAGVGAAIGQRANPRIALGSCQLLLCVAMAAAAYVLARWLPYWPIDVTLPATAAVALQLDLLRVTLVALPAALLWGASFPLALAAAASPGRDPQQLVGELYAANTVGAILGALTTTFVLVVWLGSQRTQQLAIALSACSGLLMLFTARRGAALDARRLAVGATLAAAAFGLASAVPALPPALVAYGRFLPTRGADANVVYVGEGLTASIAVSQEPSGVRTYHNAGKTQASTYPQDLRLQRMLGHLATLIPERPSTVLVIGLGAGITAGAVSVDPAVQRVVVAELEPLAATVAGEYFAEHNYGVVTNPKVEMHFDDGRHLLATTTERFDAITSDPLDPWVKGAAALYTREFWQLCRARLNDGGVVTVFLQLYESTEDAVRSEIATFLEVFPHGAVFANTVEGAGYDAVLVGRATDAPIDLARIERLLDRADYAPVAHSLRASGFDSALDLFSTYAGAGGDLASWLEGAAINTDRNLRLQYLAGQGLNATQAGVILERLIGDGPQLPAALFTGTPAQLEELRQRLGARHGRY